MKKLNEILGLIIFLCAAVEALLGISKHDSITMGMACFMLLGGIYANTLHRK